MVGRGALYFVRITIDVSDAKKSPLITNLRNKTMLK